MSAILSRIVKETDLAAIEKMVVVKRRTLGPKYDRYKERVIEVLGSKYPSAIAGLDTVELKQIITVVDIIGVESHGMMKRLGGACTGCGWCCSQTAGIIVTAEDAERISREMKKRRKTCSPSTVGNGASRAPGPASGGTPATAAAPFITFAPAPAAVGRWALMSRAKAAWWPKPTAIIRSASWPTRCWGRWRWRSAAHRQRTLVDN